MLTYTSSLPKPLLDRLSKAAKKLKLPKNQLIQRALEIYLDQLNRAEYVQSFRRAGQDQEVMAIAEEGMVEYLAQVKKGNEAS